MRGALVHYRPTQPWTPKPLTSTTPAPAPTHPPTLTGPTTTPPAPRPQPSFLATRIAEANEGIRSAQVVTVRTLDEVADIELPIGIDREVFDKTLEVAVTYNQLEDKTTAALMVLLPV